MKIYLACWKYKKSLIHKLISFFTFCAKYTHSELIIEGEWLSSEFGTGVRRSTDISGNPEKWDIYEVVVSEMQQDLMSIEFARLEGKSYDWKGVFLSQLIPFGIHNDEKWFCSELCAHLINHSGAMLLPEANLLSPKDLYRCMKPKLKRVENSVIAS